MVADERAAVDSDVRPPRIEGSRVGVSRLRRDGELARSTPARTHVDPSVSTGPKLIAILGMVAIAFASVWTYVRFADGTHERRARRDRGAIETPVDPAQRRAILRSASARYLPPETGIELGMTLDEVRLVHPTLRAMDSTTLDVRTYEDELPDDRRLVLTFDTVPSLIELQVMDTLDGGVAAIAPYLAASRERVGPATGVWDCPRTANIPTRRFTYRSDLVSAADIFLVYGDRVSVTTVVTTTDRMAASLIRSACHPIEPGTLDQFPTADPAAVRTP